MNNKIIKFDKVVIDCIDPGSLAEFYIKLLGWSKGYDYDGFVIIGSETSNVDIGFQRNPDYLPPVWPEAQGAQQQMLHLDFAVERCDHQYWVEWAKECGATVAGFQYSDEWTVMLDPEGHPFCIDLM